MNNITNIVIPLPILIYSKLEDIKSPLVALINHKFEYTSLTESVSDLDKRYIQLQLDRIFMHMSKSELEVLLYEAFTYTTKLIRMTNVFHVESDFKKVVMEWDSKIKLIQHCYTDILDKEDVYNYQIDNKIITSVELEITEYEVFNNVIFTKLPNSSVDIFGIMNSLFIESNNKHNKILAAILNNYITIVDEANRSQGKQHTLEKLIPLVQHFIKLELV